MSKIKRNEGTRCLENSLPEAIYMVVVVYYAEYLTKLVKVMTALAAQQRVSALRVVINNPSISDDMVRSRFSGLPMAFEVLRHDNKGFEFGAYQRGLDDLKRCGKENFACLFANDTVGNHQRIDNFYLRNFGEALSKHLGTNAIVGLVNSAPRRLELCDLHASRWIRSNFFVADQRALANLRDMIYVPEVDACINDSPRESEFFSQHVGPSLCSHISNWLFSGSAGAWYKSEPLSVSNHLAMAAKARCILQELFLSMRLEVAATALIQPAPLKKVEKVLVRLGCASI